MSPVGLAFTYRPVARCNAGAAVPRRDYMSVMPKSEPATKLRRRRPIKLSSAIRPLKGVDGQAVGQALDQWAAMVAGDELTTQLANLGSPNRRVRLSCRCCRFTCTTTARMVERMGLPSCPAGSRMQAVIGDEPVLEISQDDVLAG